MEKFLWLKLDLWMIILSVFFLTVSGRQRFKKFIEPRFLEVGRNITKHIGETAVLKCAVENLGPKMIVWRKESENFPLSAGDRMYAQKDEMSINYHRSPDFDRVQANLIIKRVQLKHSGKYECQISAAKIYRYHVHLNVLNTPVIYEGDLQIKGTVYVSKYQPINLTCNATGSVRAPEDIDWFHNGHKIRQNGYKWRNRTYITKYQTQVPGRSLISGLLIEHSQQQDAGTYICRSSDRHTKSIMVHVLNAGSNPKERHVPDTNEYIDYQKSDNSSPRLSLATEALTLLVIFTICR